MTVRTNNPVCVTPLSAEPEVKQIVEMLYSVSTLDEPVTRGVKHADKHTKIRFILYVVTLVSHLLFFSISWLKEASSSFFTNSTGDQSSWCNLVQVNEERPQKNTEPNRVVPQPKYQ